MTIALADGRSVRGGALAVPARAFSGKQTLTCEWSNARSLIVSDRVRDWKVRDSGKELQADRRVNRALDGGLFASFAGGSDPSIYSARRIRALWSIAYIRFFHQTFE
jgi:hypothetical protein